MYATKAPRFSTLLEIRFVGNESHCINGFDSTSGRDVVSVLYRQYRKNAKLRWDSFKAGFNLTPAAIEDLEAISPEAKVFIGKTGGEIRFDLVNAAKLAEKVALVLAKPANWVGATESDLQPSSVTLVDSPIIDTSKVLIGKLLGKQLVAFCPYCRHDHFHGWPKGSTGKPQHRVAHCLNDSSPYRKTGYFIAPEQEQ